MTFTCVSFQYKVVGTLFNTLFDFQNDFLKCKENYRKFTKVGEIVNTYMTQEFIVFKN